MHNTVKLILSKDEYLDCLHLSPISTDCSLNGNGRYTFYSGIYTCYKRKNIRKKKRGVGKRQNGEMEK